MDSINCNAMVNIDSFVKKLITLFFCVSLIAVLYSCNKISEGAGGMFEGIEGELGFSDELCGSNLMAYITEDDSSIYVSEMFENEIRQTLDAKIEGDIWIYKNENGDLQQRPKKELKIARKRLREVLENGKSTNIGRSCLS